jgi:methylated-DNA-protein-cysteine methyltransferase-like protein
MTMIRQIPRGKVATYGQIACLAGIPRNSRQVGAILRSLPTELDLPWFRVVNSKGEISFRGNPNSEQDQRAKLESEGVEFNDRDRISLKQFGWEPQG